jgi:hypothetical protein
LLIPGSNGSQSGEGSGEHLRLVESERVAQKLSFKMVALKMKE